MIRFVSQFFDQKAPAGQIARDAFVDLIGPRRRRRINHRVQFVEVRQHRFGRKLRLLRGLGDDETVGLAHIVRLRHGERRVCYR